VRGYRNSLPGLVAVILALLVVVIAVPLNVVSGYLPGAVTAHRLLWIGLAATGLLAIGGLTWLSRWLAGRVADVPVWQVPPVEGWVDREELPELVSALTAADSQLAALTIALVGAGGFGKTMLAAKACHIRAVRRSFRGGIIWVTLGRDLAESGLAIRISEVIASIGGEARPFTSAESAGQALATALASRGRTLVVVDDVWTADQLEPFRAAAQSGRLLVTTQRPSVLANAAACRIQVGAMTDEVARRLLRRDLPAMAAQREQELLELTSGFPLQLNLVNRRLADDLRRPGGAIDAAAAAAGRRLRLAGPSALDITDSGRRQTAVTATVDYSLDALKATDRDRFFELGAFAEDLAVPITVIGLLWQGSARLSMVATEALCERLDELSLVTLVWDGDVLALVLHDVIRDVALGRLDSARRTAAHAALICAARQLAEPAEVGVPATVGDQQEGKTAVWAAA
jgi:hypothetical protein